MAIYHYQALDQDGGTRKGTYDANSENDVRQFLKSEGLYPTDIRMSRFSSALAPNIGFNWRKLLPERRNYNKELTAFTRQLETLLEATIPYDKALEMIIGQTSNQVFKSVLSDIRSRVMEGEPLADAMSHHPQFSKMYVSMVRSGESSGTLDKIMKRLAEYYENQDRLISQLKSAMIYPLFMTLFGIGMVSFMMVSIVPKITQIFEAQDADLPPPTVLLIFLSKVFTQYWHVLLVLMVVTLVGIWKFLGTPKGALFKDRIFLKLPGVKVLVVKVMVLRFCETLGTLLNSGVDLKSALEIAKHVVANHVFLKELERMIVDVNNKGVPLSAAMKRVAFFPDYVYHVVAIGEQAAKVDELLEKVASRMQTEVSGTVDGLTSLIQPLMILLMGGAVGFIALAILLPMLNMSQLLQ